jgi:hypothetical protein
MIYHSPDALLQKMGVTAPQDIDIEAIAYYCGAIVKYRHLEGCAARIVGINDKAIITVDECSSRGRQRFSVAHELGHWMNHRGTAFLQCQNTTIFSFSESRSPETIANYFASDLILPEYLFKPAATNLPLTFDSASKLSNIFETSLTATAIRLIQFGSYPGILACYEITGKRKWFKRTYDVPSNFMPALEVHHDSQAFDLLYGKIEKTSPTNVNAGLWFSHPLSNRYTIQEHSVKINIGKGYILSFLYWKDESQLREINNDNSCR